MAKRNLHLIGFVLIIFSSVIIVSCSEEKVEAESVQPASLSYHEEFDSLQRVIDMGWKAVNLSDPVGGNTWQSGYYEGVAGKFGPEFYGFPANSHKASANEYAYVNFNCGAGLSFINCWLITPTLTMKNGDIISFWTRTSDVVSYPDRMQVWLNPTNDGTNVGRTANETGDFTIMLKDINPNLSPDPYPVGYPTAWTKVEITISGLPNGTIAQKHRIGFRYYVKNGGPSGGVSDQIGIDDFDFISQ